MSILRVVPRTIPAESRALTLLGAAALVGALAGFTLGRDAVDHLIYRAAASREQRLHALERLLARGRGLALLEHALRDEEGSLHDRALELATELAPDRADNDEDTGARVRTALRERIERATDRATDHAGCEPTLEDLRVLAALGDEDALPGLLRLLRTTERRHRAAAFTAFAAIVARRHVPAARLPTLEWGERWILGELALGLEEDSPPWRGDALRALAARIRASPIVVARLRAELRPADGRSALVERAVLWLRGDPLALVTVPAEQRDRIGLLAPLEALRARVDGRFLDAVLALDQWGGAGDWRWLQVARPEVLARALARARDPTRPAARAAALLLAAAPGSLAIGEIENAPPYLLERLGPADVPAIVQAAGRLDGRLVRVLEPGAGDARERFLLDVAVAALSTNARPGR